MEMVSVSFLKVLAVNPMDGGRLSIKRYRTINVPQGYTDNYVKHNVAALRRSERCNGYIERHIFYSGNISMQAIFLSRRLQRAGGRQARTKAI